MAGLEIVVDGRWQSLDVGYGDDQMSTVMPGGSDELTWTPSSVLARKARGGAPTQAFWGGVPVFAGLLAEPDASQPTLTAEGAFRAADGWPALDGAGNATATPDTAITTAIAGGLPWRLPPGGIFNTGIQIDLSSGPVDVADLLTTRANNNTQRWWVDPTFTVRMAADPTTPTLQVFQRNGLGFDLTNYASTLIGRYVDNVTSTVKTASATDATAARLHGPRPRTLNLTGLGPITLAKAQSVLSSFLALGASTPSWTAPIQVTYGQIVNAGFAPVALARVPAGQMVRVHGGYDLAARLNGQTYLDVVIGQTYLAGGVLTIQPIGFTGRRSLEDALNLAIAAIARKANR